MHNITTIIAGGSLDLDMGKKAGHGGLYLQPHLLASLRQGIVTSKASVGNMVRFHLKKEKIRSLLREITC
jgi:hypothetical protein